MLGKLVALPDARNIIAGQCAGFRKGSNLPRLKGREGYYGKHKNLKWLFVCALPVSGPSDVSASGQF